MATEPEQLKIPTKLPASGPLEATRGDRVFIVLVTSINVIVLLVNAYLVSVQSQRRDELMTELVRMSKAYNNATATVVHRLANPKAELKVTFVVDSHLPTEHRDDPGTRTFKTD